MKITYTPEYSPSMRGKIQAQYKHVFMELYIADEGVCIDGMQSSNQGKGACQEMIDLLREDFKGKELSGSPPLSEAAKHIFDKKGVVYPEGKGTYHIGIGRGRNNFGVTVTIEESAKKNSMPYRLLCNDT